MAFSFIQTKQFATGAGTQLLGTFTSSITKNNVVIVNIKIGDATHIISSVTDDKGNTYSQAGTAVINASGPFTSYQFYGVQTIGGGSIITITSNASSALRVTIDEFSGGALTNALIFDKVASGTGANTSSSIPFSPSFNGELISAGITINNAGLGTAGAGYVLTSNQTNQFVQYRLASTIPETAPMTFASSNFWTEIAGVYKSLNSAGTNLIQSSGTAVLGIGSTSVTWGANTTTGNLIVVGISLTNAAIIGTVSSITDNQSNTYTKAIAGSISSLGDVLNAELWYAKSITGGAGSVTVNHTIDNCAMFAREYTGFNTLDKTNAANGSSTTPNSGTSAVTTQATELVIIATGDDNGPTQTWLPSGNYGNMVGTATTITGLSMEDTIVTNTGVQTGTLILGASANWEALLATFYNVSDSLIINRSLSLLGVGN